MSVAPLASVPMPRPVWPLRVAWTVAILLALLGLLAELAALTGIQQLASLVPNAPMMAPSTGLCFLLSALSVVLIGKSCQHTDGWSGRMRWIVRVIGAVVLAIGAVVLWRSWFGDVQKVTPSGEAFSVARMSQATSLNFILVGMAIMLVRRERWIFAYQLLCLLVIWIGWMGVSRFLYGGEPLSFILAMSLNTSIAFVLLGIGLICVRTTGGIMELLCAGTEGGVLLRRLLPYVVVLPIFFGWLHLLGQQAGWYGTEAGLSLFAMANVTLFGGLVLAYARRLHVLDMERRHQTRIAAHLAEVVRSSDDAIVSKNLDGIITSWNAGAIRLYGYTVEEAIGMPIQNLMLPADRQQEDDIRRTILGHGTVKHLDALRLRKDGTVIAVSMSISPIYDDRGTIVGISNIARDISERKAAEAKLHANLARLDLLRQVTNAIREHHDLASIYQVVVRCLEDQMLVDFACICTFDGKTNHLTVSRIGTKSQVFADELAMKERTSFAVDRNGLSRCVQGELVYETNLERINAPFPNRLANAGLHSLIASPLMSESLVTGVILVARTKLDAFTSADSEFVHQLSAHVALAVRHAEIHGALQQAYDDLRQTQQAVMQHERLRALGQMASGIAHDINNALTPVLMYADRLTTKESNLTERGRHDLQMIMRAAEDITATVARLREFYRQQNQLGKMSGIDVPVVIQQVLDLTRSQWQDTAEQRGVTIVARADVEKNLPFVVGVETELREALVNLTLNAIDAMPNGGELVIRARSVETLMRPDGTPGGRAVQIEVVDSGVGMDEQVRQRCLEPFFTTKGERGTGLGLAMVFGIVQRHGGEIAIDSAVGRGTTFRLSFFNLTMARSPTVQELAQVPRRLRLLLIDDDPIVIKALSDLLNDDGHELTTANGGQAGIDAFRASLATSSRIDVVITDLGMPQVDGRRVAEAVKTASPTTPVLMLTGWGKRLNEDDQLPVHVDMVLSKPPKIHEIRAALHQLCSR